MTEETLETIREIAKAKIKKHSLKSADVLCYQHFYS
jgi:hypothetical protein